MNGGDTENPKGRKTLVSIESLYFDPNNYRIVDNPEYSKVPEENVLEKSVQRRTMQFILGNNQQNVKDLIASIVANGWLELDPILVDQRKRSAYLVIEGNRRVAALKHLNRRHREASIDLGKLDSTIFSKLPVVIHDSADERKKLILMGLHHISGKRRWPAVNRAHAIRDLQKMYDGNTNDVCNALGISKQEHNISVRTLALVEVYKQSDYGDQFQSEKFNLFREIIQNAHIREWLGWDNQELKAKKFANLDKLFRWMSSDLGQDSSEFDDDLGASAEVEPILTTVGHIRELAKIINDKGALLRLDETHSLQEATLSSTLLVQSEVAGALKIIDSGIQKLNKRSANLATEDQDRAMQLAGMLQWTASPFARHPYTPGERLPRAPFNEITQSQFSNIQILDYRGLNGLKLDQLKRINLIAGVNNAGKTSLLEAIFLLTRQNDENALLNAVRWRGRLEQDPGWLWFVEQIPSRISIEGHFDDVKNNYTRLDVRRIIDPQVSSWNSSTFLAKYEITSCYADQEQKTDVVLSTNLPPAANFPGRNWLCRSSFTAPSWIGRSDELAKANRAAVEIGTKLKVIEFIKNNIDKNVKNIELVDKFNRFLVNHENFDLSPDLSTFGDGMGRIFQIGMLLASVQGGVLLVDEFESAIHKDLLGPFAKLIRDLAMELNVQVFLTSHSKEALDAFITNVELSDDIVGFALKRDEGNIGVNRFEGKRLNILHDALDFDLRGIKGGL